MRKERFAIQIMNPINIESVINAYYTCCINAQCYFKKMKSRVFLTEDFFEVANIFIPKNLPLTEYPDERKTL